MKMNVLLVQLSAEIINIASTQTDIMRASEAVRMVISKLDAFAKASSSNVDS